MCVLTLTELLLFSYSLFAALFTRKATPPKAHVSRLGKTMVGIFLGCVLAYHWTMHSCFFSCKASPPSNPQKVGHVSCRKHNLGIQSTARYLITDTVVSSLLGRAKTEEPDFFELEKVSPLPTLAEAQLRIDARKMRRMHQQYNNGDVLRVPSSTRTNIPPGHLTSEHHQQVNAQRKALKDGEAPEKGGAEKATATEASGSPGDSVDKTAGYQGELMGHGSSSNSRLMEHERFLQMREDQLFYHHQMNMMQANSLGLPYGGMGPLGNSPYNHPYTMAPPS